MDAGFEQLANRIRRVHRHLRKWARRSGVTCYRLYERDIPDQPLIVDWYDGDAVTWTFERRRNDTPAQEEEWTAGVRAAVMSALDLPEERVWMKRRFRQRDRREGGGQYQRLERSGAIKIVEEHGLRFEVNLSDYLDTGLFLDHRPTRARVRADASGKAVLNLFAYTGAFTVHARAGGAAATTTVDMSNTYLDWAGRNLALNGFSWDQDHVAVRADCLQWLDAAPTAPQRYDIIVCDPPTFSNSAGMQRDFSVDRDHPWLLRRCHELLLPGGTCWFSTNSRSFQFVDPAALPPFDVEDVTEASIPEDFRNRRIHRCWRLRRR